jgi:hypothetical protein
MPGSIYVSFQKRKEEEIWNKRLNNKFPLDGAAAEAASSTGLQNSTTLPP